jgi:hypothetical protein
LIFEARNCAAPVDVVSGTNTEKRIETLLPVSRGLDANCCNAKRGAERRVFIP